MQTYLALSYPTPTTSTHTFGVVTAADEESARQLVLDQLELDGLDITGVLPEEIGLVLWHNENTPYGKSSMHFG